MTQKKAVQSAAETPEEEVDALQGALGPAGGEEGEGLGEGAGDDRQHGERQQAAEDEDAPPAEARDEEDGGDAADRGADRVSRGHDDDAELPAPGRGVLGHDGGEARQHGADGEAGDDAGRGELQHVLGERRQEHADGDAEDAREGHPAPPQAVRQGSDEEGARGHAREARAEEQAQLLRREPPFFGDHRRREGDRQDVETVDRVQDHAHHDRHRLERRHRLVVDHRREVGVGERLARGVGPFHSLSRLA
jgi:hypothetical protein